MTGYIFGKYSVLNNSYAYENVAYYDINNSNKSTGKISGVNKFGPPAPLSPIPFTADLSDGNNPKINKRSNIYYIYGINDGGQFIANDYNGFVIENSDGTITPLVLPGLYVKSADLDTIGRVFGTYEDSNYVQHGFILSGGIATTLDPPGSVDTYIGHANNNGQVAGYYTDASGSDHGFYYTIGGGYTEIDDPGYKNTRAFGINDFGQVVGEAGNSINAGSNAPDSVAFVYSNSTFNSITNVDSGSSDGFVPSSINDYGQIVGADSSDNAVSAYETLNPVYRFYDTVTNDHFYTLDPNEKASIQANLPTFTYEGAPWATPDKGSDTEDVFRFFDTVTKTHFLTADSNEADAIRATLPSFTYEGVAFEAYETVENASDFALERFYNTDSHVHTYSASLRESAAITSGQVGQGWVDEGASFIVHKPLAS